MMKCSKTECGRKGTSSFCSNCGSKMETDSTNVIVICDGKIADGTPCHAELTANQNFCNSCGRKVDQQLFMGEKETCSSCGTVLQLGIGFCPKCGLKITEKKLDPDSPAVLSSGGNQPLDSANQTPKQATQLQSGHGDTLSDHAEVETSSLNNRPHDKTDNDTTRSNDDLKNDNMDREFYDSQESVTDQDGEIKPANETGSVPDENHEEVQSPDKNIKKVDTEQNHSKEGCDYHVQTDQSLKSLQGESRANEKEDTNIKTGNLNITFKDYNSPKLSQQLENVSIKAEGRGNLNIIDDSEKKSTILQDEEQNDDDSNTDGDNDDFLSISSKESNCVDKAEQKRRKKNKRKKDQKRRKKERESKLNQEGKPEADGTDDKKKDSKNEDIKGKFGETESTGNDVHSCQSNNAEEENTVAEKKMDNLTKPDETDAESHIKGNNNEMDTGAESGINKTNTDAENAVNKPVFGLGTNMWEKDQKQNKPANQNQTYAGLFNTDNGRGTTVSTGKQDKKKETVLEMANHHKNEKNNDNTASQNADDKKDNNCDLNKASGSRDYSSDVDGTDVDRGVKTRSQTKSGTNSDQKDTKTKGQNETTDKKNKDAEPKRPMGQHNQNEEKVSVHFHVLISPEFKYTPANDEVFVRFGAESGSYLGDWSTDIWKLKFVRNHDIGIVEMGIEIAIPKRFVKKTLEYKYIIKKKKDRKNKPFVFLWDYYYRRGRAGAEVNRHMKLPDKWNFKDTWHQFDGVMNSEPKEGLFTVFKDFLTRKGKFTKDAEITLQVFGGKILQPLLEVNTSAQAVIESVEMSELLMFSIRRIYYNDTQCWSTEADLKKNVGVLLLQPLVNTLRSMLSSNKQENEKEFQKRIITTLSAVVIAKKLGLPEFKIEDKLRGKICRSLLIHPVPETKSCKELDFIDTFFPKKRALFKDALVLLAKSAVGREKDPSWMYLLPLIHFLSEACTPYQAVSKDTKHDRAEPVWWGISHVGQDTIKAFKQSNLRWEISLHEVMATLSPLFVVDFFLPRSIAACLNLSEVKEAIQSKLLPVEVCCATLVFHMRDSEYFHMHEQQARSNQILRCIETVLAQLREQIVPEDPSDSEIEEWWLRSKLAMDLLTEALKYNLNLTGTFSAQIYVHCASLYERSIRKTKDCAAKMKTNLENIRRMNGEVIKWLNRNWSDWQINLTVCLVTWNEAMAGEQMQSEAVRDMWNKQLTESLSSKLKGSSIMYSNYDTECFVKLYCQKLETYKPCMQDCLNDTAFKAIEKAYGLDIGNFSNYEKEKFGNLLSKMFQTEWENMRKNSSDPEDERVLKHVLKWSPFLHFLQIFYTKQQFELLTEECKFNLVTSISAIDSRVDALLKGTITIGNLRLIHAQQDRFSDLAELVKGVKEGTGVKANVAMTVKVRMKELEAFQEQAARMTTLSSLCQSHVDVSALDCVLNKQRDLDKHVIGEFCAPADVRNVTDLNSFQPNIKAFKVSAQVLHVTPQLHYCYKSSMFMKMWESRCQEKGQQCHTLDDVVKVICEPVLQRWKKTSQNIKDGAILFQDMEKLVGNTYKEDYNNMQEELRTLRLTNNEIISRINQLKEFRQLAACVHGAKVVLKFAKEYKLTGDFEPIRVIASHSQNRLVMSSFDRSLMDTCRFLKALTVDRANCLVAFVNCGRLVNWLKESMKKAGLKELKVFVDLAFMSAGDEPMNIKRVQCLHSAVTGYAPLIFDLNTESGYVELLEMCNVVWRELDADPNLPQKLKDTNDHIQWLTEIKKAHGSVEVTSLVQADDINSHGIYTVGTGANRNASSLDMSSMLRLTVPEDKEGKRQLRNYTFSQLQDLQSRLMLVAGKAEKGNVGVERFTTIFDSVMRLSNVYMKLCSAGCVLFKNWTARFLCDPGRPACASLEFGQGNDVPTMKGRRTESEDLQDFIPRLAKFMETCLEEWLDHIGDKRKKYLLLNYFTVDQLVILQRELVKFGTQEELVDLIYPLLSAVKHDCTPDDLLEAMTAAKAELNSDVEMEEVDDTENMGTASNGEGEDETEDMKRQKFIKDLVAAGFEEHLAIRALEHISPEDVTEGIIWCMRTKEDDEEMEDGDVDDDNPSDMVQRTPERDVERPRPAFSGWSQSERSIQSVITSNISGLTGTQSGVEPLIRNLTELWHEFLGSITSNIQDYLSMEHLGVILKHLAKQDKRFVNRNLPAGLEEGSPNLIICPSGDVLSTALSLYMLEKDQPLPQSDEVLMCTTNTTIDEVDIFWRRAIFDGGEKIHCLVNADLLDFEVSEAAERCLEQYMQEINYQDLAYCLVVLCGSDNEYRSRIVASLDKHRRPALPVNTHHLREYLATKLRVNKQFEGVKHAASVDFDRSSVRLIKSWRSGVGKTLYKNRREADLARINHGITRPDNVSIPLQEKHIDLHSVISRLLEHTECPGQSVPRIFHLDVAHEVQFGVDYLLFNLLVLGCLVDKTGYVWRKSLSDLYLIETMPLMIQTTNQRSEELQYVHQMLFLLPDMTCRSPQESLNSGRGAPGYKKNDQLFDVEQFQNPIFQRPFQYLSRLDRSQNLDNINPQIVEGSQELCLQSLLRHCGMHDPSWAELHHFVWFLNTQLCNFEQNSFVSVAAAEDLPGFSKFVLRFLIQMSRDFSTRSLNMSEESPGVKYEPAERMEEEEGGEEDEDGELERYQMRRTWESSPHPYLFFNSDKFTFTFLGFNIDRATGNLIDQQTRRVLDTGIMAQNLYDSLVRNHAPIKENFDSLPRDKKIEKLCMVMGIDMPHDPDNTYELTTDNVKKILAIYMRFRCDIPVIIMGETGCGKTRLIKFMCALQTPPGVDAKNMILMKVHGGTTNSDIIRKVREAEIVAHENVQQYGQNMFTVLFFDEANTTESIGLIKEIMCDKSMEGKKLTLCENLKMVAACNPYRKHSDELIKKLEQAGLGYHVDADETTDKLGRVPMRRLVYRVQPLPQSLLPLVWDFGQLNYEVEDLYIRQMVRRYIRDDNLPDIDGLVEIVSGILTASQNYMREQKDECSFVSLRDVDRVLSMMSWFYIQSQGDRTLYNKMDVGLNDAVESSEESEPEDEDEMEVEENVGQKGNQELDDITRSLVLALGVCYHACLKTRPQYRERIATFFRQPCQLPGGADQIEREIICCQDVFLDNVQLEKNIARNMALKENLFMMVVCIELRIPLFLVGKPGSSKSLAKTIVSDAMQGNAARKELFKELKQAQMVSFQCSPLSTPDGIMGTFRQCAQFQKDKDLNSFVSIVVLDEVGLAEDSPRMPLKTLHPLLEDGCQGDEKPEKYKKVAFIGISNWALDPAKMNRGILVQREVPDQEELQNSARGICYSESQLQNVMEPFIEPMADSYLETFEKASSNMREFFGLRDFYSLVKMIYSFVEKSRRAPTWHQMLHAIKRNFGGLDQVNPVDSFRKHLASKVILEENPRDGDPDCTAAGLIQACLFDTNNTQSESRYLLLLTENYGALTILEQQILDRHTDIRPIIIFGSSFRSDQEYTQVCRNINKIKVCMETGNTVVLLNLENLYESLYDALNQYYVYFGGERYVDLGLGTHRVKCPVHKDFRLIVVAEKQTVYKKFPIPLINRLEKHFLTINTMLSKEQQEVVKTLEDWAKQFSEVKQNNHAYRRERKQSNKVGDVFMGYHDDTCSAIVLHVWGKNEIDNKNPDQVFHEAKVTLLWCATPDAVARLEKSNLPHKEQQDLIRIYNQDQKHDNIVQYLQYKINHERCEQLFAQVTTHSKLLAGYHKIEVSKATGIALDSIMLLDTLSSFDTEQQFSNKIMQHLQRRDENPSLLIIQCDSGDINANLVACARYCVMDEYQNVYEKLQPPVHIVFIVQLPRIAGGCFTGFQCGKWQSVHIDDLWSNDVDMPSILDMQNKSVAKLIGDAVDTPTVPMETDENMELENHINKDDDENMDCDEYEVIYNRRGAQTTTKASGLQQVPDAEEDPIQSTSAAGYQLENVIDEFEVTGGRAGIAKRGDGTGYHGPKLNVKSLILSCVQAALSMVKDKDENSVRTTDRVPLVLKLFHNKTDNGSKPFLEGVSLLIAFLLKEKEANTQSYGANQWLVEEAAKFESIHKAGTFRRSCIQTLESKISPILAGIIAYLDRNQNLSILQDDQLPWKQELWLSVLKTPGALNLKYSDLQSPARQSDLQEAVVMTTGCEGHVFQSHFPFSWLIYDQITDILKTQEVTHLKQDDEDPSLEIVRLLSETAIGKVFQRIQDNTIVQEIVKEYTYDYVHVKYHAKSDQECMLVIQSVNYVTEQMAANIRESPLLHMLVCVHMSYQSLAPRLAYFRTMNQVWPECSLKIVELRQTIPDHFMFKETEFTFSALSLMIENLKPEQAELDNQDGRARWLKKVHQYRPVVEKVLSLHAEDPEKYGAHGVQSVQRARGLWSRVVTMKLFLEHVCATKICRDKVSIKRCMPLWTLLTEEADLKELKSLRAVESFLKLCNQAARKEYFQKEERCCNCEALLEGPPITLPCKDMVCDQCYHDLRALDDGTCPKCKQTVDLDWKPERQAEKKVEAAKLKDYQKRCNTFFMDMVSQLCFANNTPPSDQVIDKLLGYITCTTRKGKGRQVTKELTIFDSGIDPNPVFRSFLLQLLMRTSEDKVKENLEKYLSQAEGLLKQDGSNEKQYVELCLLIIQCLEDIFVQEINKTDVDETVYARTCLHNASNCIPYEDEQIVDKLYALAEARVGLSVAAKYIKTAVQLLQKGEIATVDTRVRKLIEAAQRLCQNGDLQWPWIYLVKYMCRCYGIDIYQAACKSQVAFLRWIRMPNTNRDKVVEISDRYVVCGNTYTAIRESITKVLLGEDINQLIETLQGMRTAAGHVDVMFQLAIHREITCSNLYPQQQRTVSPEVVNKLAKAITDNATIQNKNLLQALLHNQLGGACRQLTVTEGADLRHQGLQCLLVHFLCVMSQSQGDRTLLQPLIKLLTSPQTCNNMYLPTMPQDDLEEIRNALLAARHTPAGAGENPVFYRCPNGHPYIIGNCGNPASVDRCRECAAEIGGMAYKLRPGNTKDQSTDSTLTGHILGRPEARGQGPMGQRTLSPTYCSFVRLITHMAMYGGATTDIQGVQTLIVPDMKYEDIPMFLWQHIMLDLEDLQKVLGKSVDDVLLLGHSVVDRIMKTHNEGNYVADEVCQLTSKNGRNDWEEKFSASFIQPILLNMDTNLKTNNQLLVQDKRLGADPLLCLLYETDSHEKMSNQVMMQNVPSTWRYRTLISIQHVKQEFEAKNAGKKVGENKVLELFFKEEPYLRAIRYIPSILRLHRALFHMYQRKLDKAEASTITVGQLKKEEILGEDTAAVIQDFAEAWELVREALKMYSCPTEVGLMTVPKDYCVSHVDDKTPISMLLPTTKEVGLCSFALLDFLMRKQNDFLDNYLKMSKRKSESASTIPAKEVTSAHLISYDPQNDILPLVLANCQYSFEIGKGTKIEYDFTSLERQLMDRFLFSKSRIDMGRVLQIDLMVYRSEFTNVAVFKKLADKIPQESLSLAVKSQICSEIRSLPDLCLSLDNLDITISFLKSIGGNKQHILNEFMIKTLKMKSSLQSQKAKQVCEFQHTQSLWMVLSFQKSKQMAEHSQPRESIFESVIEEFHEDLPEDTEDILNTYMRNLSIDKLTQLLEVLHEYILLKVAVRENPDDEDYTEMRDNKMTDWLYGYIEGGDQFTQELLPILADFPEDILHKHSVHTWIIMYAMLREKQTGNRRR